GFSRADNFRVAHASCVSVSASRRNSLSEKSAIARMRSPTRETRALPEKMENAVRQNARAPLVAVARSDPGKFFPAQTKPVVPGLSHAVARGEVALVELVAFENLGESRFHRQLFAVEDGIRGSDRGGMMCVARCCHGQAAQLCITKRERVVAAQSGSGIENLQCIDR